MEQQNSDLQEKREARRRRRVRNQILVHATTMIVIIALGAGIMLGVKYIMEQSMEKQLEKEDQVENLFSEEEDIPEPEEEQFFDEPEIVELTPQEKLDMIVDARIEVMPLEDKVAGLFIVTPESITGVDKAVKAGDGTKEALSQYAVGGIIYDAKNIQNEAQFKEMIENTKMFSTYPLFIAMEEEGGDFSPLAKAGLCDKTDTAAQVAGTGDTDNAYQLGSLLGGKLAELGINLNFAPVADLDSVEGSVIGSRSYGSNFVAVGAFVSSMVRGLEDQRVDTCLKHFPGMGSTTQDTDKGLASTDRSADDFRANEFAVFLAGVDAGADMVLVSNMSAPAFSGEGDKTPCSMSSAVVTDVLRNELNFNGVIITDAMNMKAISEYYGADEAAILALRAGCDMILMPEDFGKAYEGVLTAVQNGEISEERINDALRRIYRIKDADKLEE